MSTTINKYRVWCNTESTWVETWDSQEPTLCPNHNEHEINTSKTVSIDSVTQEFPKSDIDNFRMAVHVSAKPVLPNKTTYVVWTGAGDDMVNNLIGDGDLLQFNLVPGIPSQSIRAQFLPQHGRVWIHQGYIKFQDGGLGDYLEATVVAIATPIQTAAYLNLEIVGEWLVPSANGTHGFADPSKISLIPRTFSKDGYWDFDGTNLTPNLTGTGEYHISHIDQVIHRYVNKVPTRGICENYIPLTSHDTSEIPTNYCLELTAHNVSNTSWWADIILEIYRERTCEP